MTLEAEITDSMRINVRDITFKDGITETVAIQATKVGYPYQGHHEGNNIRFILDNMEVPGVEKVGHNPIIGGLSPTVYNTANIVKPTINIGGQSPIIVTGVLTAVVPILSNGIDYNDLTASFEYEQASVGFHPDPQAARQSARARAEAVAGEINKRRPHTSFRVLTGGFEVEEVPLISMDRGFIEEAIDSYYKRG